MTKKNTVPSPSVTTQGLLACNNVAITSAMAYELTNPRKSGIKVVASHAAGQRCTRPVWNTDSRHTAKDHESGRHVGDRRDRRHRRRTERRAGMGSRSRAPAAGILTGSRHAPSVHSLLPATDLGFSGVGVKATACTRVAVSDHPGSAGSAGSPRIGASRFQACGCACW